MFLQRALRLVLFWYDWSVAKNQVSEWHVASRGDKINPLGIVARKHNEHRPFEIEEVLGETALVKLSPLIALFLIAWMTLITLLSAYYVLTMKQYVSVDTWILELKTSICTMKVTWRVWSTRDHYLQQEFPENHQSQHSNKAPVRLGKKTCTQAS